jgi:hypothetical protein
MWRVSAWLCTSLCLAALALQSCGSRPTPSLVVHEGKTGGVAYEVRGAGNAKETRSANGDVEVTMGSNRLQIKGGRVMANGKDYGPVKDGDAVVLDDDGQVSVNQQKR